MKSYDLVGIGIGPFNLSTAALCSEAGLKTIFFDKKPEFDWHPGMLIPGAKMQVSFLADLVSLARPSSQYSFLSYLNDKDRLFSFYFRGESHPTRSEYVDYCMWAISRLPNLKFNTKVEGVSSHEEGGFTVTYTSDGESGEIYAKNIVLGIGTEAVVPDRLLPEGLSYAGSVVQHHPIICHSSDYLHSRSSLDRAKRLCVVGSGQSGAEVFLDQLRRRRPGYEYLTWITRSPAIAPMEESKLGLEHFTPEYMDYFQKLPLERRYHLYKNQWQLYKAVSDATITDIFNELYSRSVESDPKIGIHPSVTVSGTALSNSSIRVSLQSNDDPEQACEISVDGIVWATGYEPRDFSGLLKNISVRRDRYGAPLVREDHSLVLDGIVHSHIYVHNLEHATHGVGTPDLGLTAWRSQRIIDQIKNVKSPNNGGKGAFTSFGLPEYYW